MLLAVDIGNTSTKLGVFEGEELRATWQMATRVHCTPDEYAALLLNLLHHQDLDTADIKEVALCSVVPPLTATFEEERPLAPTSHRRSTRTQVPHPTSESVPCPKLAWGVVSRATDSPVVTCRSGRASLPHRRRSGFSPRRSWRQNGPS